MMSVTSSHVITLLVITASAQASLVTLAPDVVTNVTLQCVSESPWFFCVWETPLGQRLCSVQSRESGACGEAGPRLRLGGNNTVCELTIAGAEIGDSGMWTCALTDNNMDTVKQHRELEIALPGSLGLSVLGGEIRLEEGEQEELEMGAGENMELVCSLEQAWPVTNLSWSVTRAGAEVGEEVDIRWGELVTSQQCDLCPVTMEQRAEVRLRAWDTGLVVSCHHGERGAGVGGTIRPLLTSGDTGHLRDISTKIGLLPGLVISAVLVLLSLAVLVSFCVRGSRRRKEAALGTEDPEVGGRLVEADIVKNKEDVEDIIDDIYKDKSLNETEDSSSSDVNTSSDNSSDTNSSK